jgi:hypothetical protein
MARTRDGCPHIEDSQPFVLLSQFTGKVQPSSPRIFATYAQSQAQRIGAEATGFQAEADAEDNDWILVEHFKLLLHPEELRSRYHIQCPPSKKQPVILIATHIQCLIKYRSSVWTIYGQSLCGLPSICLQAHATILHRQRCQWATIVEQITPFMYCRCYPSEWVGPSRAARPGKSHC